jgi:hypothetical protein
MDAVHRIPTGLYMNMKGGLRYNVADCHENTASPQNSMTSATSPKHIIRPATQAYSNVHETTQTLLTVAVKKPVLARWYAQYAAASASPELTADVSS